MGKILVITSGKGGVGKTTTAINLGAALNSLNEEVIIVDANLSTPNVGLHFGAPIVPVSLNHVLLGKATPDEAIYEHESGIKIIPGSLSVKELKKLKTINLTETAKKLKKIADYVIFDSAAGLGEEALAALQIADEVIIVTNPEMPAITDALKTIKVAEDMNKEVKGIILTRVRWDKTEMPIANVKDMLERPIIGVVPEDNAVRQALSVKDAVFHTHPRSKVARAYRHIAAKIAGKPLPKRQEMWYEKLLKAFGISV